MSEWDVKGLETNFEGFCKERYPDLKPSDAFERFAVRQALKDSDLSDDEIEFGILGGGDDGGADGMYFFVNRALIQDVADLPEEALTAELVIFQAKFEKGFTETAITKLEAFAKDLLDHSRDVDSMVQLKVEVREAIRRFRDFYTKILGSSHTMAVTFVYATKTDQLPNIKVEKRAEGLAKYVQQQLSDAKVSVDYWGAQKLLAAARRTASTTSTLEISNQFSAADGSVVCLAKLGSLAALLRDDRGDMRRTMLEPNVRDYQGQKNPVNRAIRQSLSDGAAAPEFWWLNNGVTILTTKCYVVGNKLVIEKPEVVNGLQTSYEIYQFFKDHPDKSDGRTVLVRAIKPPNEQMRSKIIRATNSQTPINEVSLRATDPIHFDIEEKFRLYQLYYERRKGEYRELKKPVDRIISIQTLSRAVIAVLLQQPNNAYATPGRVLKTDYEKVFRESHNRDAFVTCILLQRQVDKYLAGRDDLKEVRSIIKYYVAMAIACTLLKKTTPPTDKELASLLALVSKPLDSAVVDGAVDDVLAAYKKHGSTETTAKGPDMRITILKALNERFAPKGKLGV